MGPSTPSPEKEVQSNKSSNNEENIQPEFSSKNKIPRKVRKLFRQKRKLSKKVFSTKSVPRCIALRNKIENIEQMLKDFYDKRRQIKESEALENIKRNPKVFYAYARKYSKSYSGIGPLVDEDGETLSKPEDIAEALLKQYNKVFTEPKEDSKIKDPEDFFQTTSSDDPIRTLFFNYQDVREAIEKLSSSAAAGPDGIPAILLLKCKETLSEPLELIFNKSLKTGEIPEIFKMAHITPAQKPRKLRNQAENYRPVSLTSHLIKTFERVIKKRLQTHLESTNKFNKSQHGFRSNRSTLSQLLSHYDEVLRGIEQGHNVDTIYLDFSKEFDKVDKGILCQKLKQIGIHGELGVWIHNFLTNRRQAVIAN